MKPECEQLSEEFISQLKEKGVTVESALSQIETFKKGIPFTELVRPCTIGDGIDNIDADLNEYIDNYESESKSKNVVKFVPASGAASRMFKELLSVIGRDGEVTREALLKDNSKESKSFLEFIDNISKFAFVDELKNIMKNDDLDLDELLNKGIYQSIVEYTLSPIGLNYSNLPKGIIEFHQYGDISRTAFEEHLVEATEYTRDSQGISRLHFTVSPEHLERVKTLLNAKLKEYETNGVKFEINYSAQKPSTDTLAVDMENKPLLDSQGKLVLRPGGHGALIENLNDLDCDIVFIKNIDNVVPDYLKNYTYTYKKALGGYLLDLQNKVFGYLKQMDTGSSDETSLDDMSKFIVDELHIELPGHLSDLTLDERASFLRSRLDRPIRVCGVVKNVGEPGGGPFWVRYADGTITKQIVESAQVDTESPTQNKVWESSTHFNPVDLVCGLKNYKGQKFDLKKYVNPDAGFISHKSKDGIDLKALELPGLWNGAMADWNTLFVEVPLITFNPVKTILDLLRPEHQPQVAKG